MIFLKPCSAIIIDDVGEKDISSLDPDVRADLMQQLELNLVNIRNQYASYVRYIRVAIEEKGIGFSDLRSFILSLLAFNKKYDSSNKQLKLFSGKKVDFGKANSIIDIFDLILECCSFLDCNVFQEIVKQYGIDCNNKENIVVRYPKILKAYIDKHRVSEFVLINPLLGNLDSKKVTLKFDIISLTCKLGTVMELQKAVANILGLRSSALKILSIEEGCILLTLLIPTSIADVLFNSDTKLSSKQIVQFQDLSALWLQCGNCIFDFKVDNDEKDEGSQGIFCRHSLQSFPLGNIPYGGKFLWG